MQVREGDGTYQCLLCGESVATEGDGRIWLMSRSSSGTATTHVVMLDSKEIHSCPKRPTSTVQG